MPCTVTGTIIGDRILSLEEDNASLTRWLCAALTVLDKAKLTADFGNVLDKNDLIELHAWIQRHNRIDAKRKQRG